MASTNTDNEEMGGVIDDIEQKLEQLEDQRDDLRREMDVKRAQIDKIEQALESLRKMQDRLS